MALMTLKKTLALPGTIDANSLYLVPQDASKASLFISNLAGTVSREAYSPTIQTQIDALIVGGGASDTGLRNRIINPSGLIDQVNIGAIVTDSAGNDPFICDRWQLINETGATIRVQQVVGVTAAATTYFTARTTTGKATILATDQFRVQQQIEGYLTADMKLGTTAAAKVRVSFTSSHSLIGKYCFSLHNAAKNRSVVLEYNQDVANAAEAKSFLVDLDQTGTWLVGNNVGLILAYDFGSGTDCETATPGVWQSGLKTRTAGTIMCASTASYLRLTDVQLCLASAPNSFEFRPYGLELDLCKRYYERLVAAQNAAYNQASAAGAVSMPIAWKVRKRAVPTVTVGLGTVQNVGVDGMTSYRTALASKAWHLPGIITANAEFA